MKTIIPLVILKNKVAFIGVARVLAKRYKGDAFSIRKLFSFEIDEAIEGDKIRKVEPGEISRGDVLDYLYFKFGVE